MERGMSSVETVEYLTIIIERQAMIIRELYSIVEQLGVTTSVDAEITSVLRDADIAISVKVEL